MVMTKARPKTDRDLQLDVLAEINRDRRFRPAELGVEVDAGVVTLTGTVSSYLKVGQAAEIATSVAGVKDVANKVTVAHLPAYDDTRIARGVRDALTLDVDVPEERIDSIVRDGVVTLRGSVDYWYQRKAAREAAAHVTGVRNVNDHVVVAPSPRSDLELYQEIKASLRRRLPFAELDVSVDQRVATLMGSVETFSTRAEAEHIAWSTVGVKNVVTKIVVR